MMGYSQVYGHGYGSGYGNMMGGSAFGGLAMHLFGLLLVVGFVLLVIWAVRASGQHGHGNPALATPKQPGMAGHDEAMAIARRRLASGEITPEQYTEIARTLGS